MMGEAIDGFVMLIKTVGVILVSTILILVGILIFGGDDEEPVPTRTEMTIKNGDTTITHYYKE